MGNETVKQLENLLYLHNLIKKERTGDSSFLAEKLHVSKRTIQMYLNNLRMYGAEILYDKNGNTYYYTNGFEMEFHLKFTVKGK